MSYGRFSSLCITLIWRVIVCNGVILACNFLPIKHVFSKRGISLGFSFNRCQDGFQLNIDFWVVLKAIVIDDVCMFVMVVFFLYFPSKVWIFLTWFRHTVPGIRVLFLLPWFHSYFFSLVGCCIGFSGVGWDDICDVGKKVREKMFIASNAGWYVVAELF